jgi:hypothetical protein
MKPKARQAKAKAATRKAPGLAAAKTLRALFESAAVRQKAHDAGQDLQRRLRDHNAAIQQRMETHRLRDMARGDTPTTARVGRAMFDPPARAPPADPPADPPRAPRPPTFGPRRMTGGFNSGTRPRSRTPTRIIRRPRTPPGPIPRARIYGPEPAGYTPAAPRYPTGTRSRGGPVRYDIGDPIPRRASNYRAFFEPP